MENPSQIEKKKNAREAVGSARMMAQPTCALLNDADRMSLHELLSIIKNYAKALSVCDPELFASLCDKAVEKLSEMDKKFRAVEKEEAN